MSKACGANCSECPLQQNSNWYVESESIAELAIVVDYPSEYGILQQYLLDKESTAIIQEELPGHLNMGSMIITPTVLCAPERGNMKALLASIRKENHEIRKENTRRAKSGEPALPLKKTPYECCAPRLQKRLKDRKYVFAIGKEPANIVLDNNHTYTEQRGMPIEIATDDYHWKVISTVDPKQFVWKSYLAEVFRSDLKKMFRWMGEGLKWSAPSIEYNPGPERLKEFLWDDSIEFYAYDIEVDSISLISSRVRCIAIGTDNNVIVIGTLGIDGYTKFYKTSSEEQEVVTILKEFFSDIGRRKVGWNSTTHDDVILSRQFGIHCNYSQDLILAHRILHPEQKHSLVHAASMYTDAPSWKTLRKDKKAGFGFESDVDLWEYCCNDVAITHKIGQQLLELVSEYSLTFNQDNFMQKICAQVTMNGVYVNRDLVESIALDYYKQSQDLKTQIQNAIEDPEFNPGSSSHLRDLMFTKWGLLSEINKLLKPSQYLTATGEPSTNELVVKSLITCQLIPQERREVLNWIRNYKRLQQHISTFLSPMELETGRLHTGYTVHSNVGGLPASRQPINVQGMPKNLKKVFVPSQGRIFVMGKYHSLDWQIFSDLNICTNLAVALQKNQNIHASITAPLFFGRTYEKIAHTLPGEKMLKLASTVALHCQVGRSLEDTYKMVLLTEHDEWEGTSEMPYSKLSLREIRMMYEKWDKDTGLQALLKHRRQHYEKYGWVENKYSARRMRYRADMTDNEIIMFEVESTIAFLMYKAMQSLTIDLEPSDRIVYLGRSSIVVECIEARATIVKRSIQMAMEQTLDTKYNPKIKEIKTLS